MKINTPKDTKYYPVISTIRFADESLAGYELQIVDKDTGKTVDGGGSFLSLSYTTAVANAIIEKLTKEQSQANPNPLPVKRDKYGIEVATSYTFDDWFFKIIEEVEEARIEANNNNREHLAEELTDVITVCVSFLNALGYNQEARAEFQRKVNDKNASRGYLK